MPSVIVNNKTKEVTDVVPRIICTSNKEKQYQWQQLLLDQEQANKEAFSSSQFFFFKSP